MALNACHCMFARRYYPAPRLFQLVPSSGPVGGGTVIQVIGYDFADAGALACRFGGAEVRPVSSKRTET